MTDRDKLIGLADKAIAEDRDHMIATGDDLLWLIAQLACHPIRVDEECTTNDRFLRLSAAATLRALATKETNQHG